MARTPSTMLDLGVKAPTFELPNYNPSWIGHGEPQAGGPVTLEQVEGQHGFLVAFICNHCPYVIHLREAMAEFAADYMPKGVGVVAINANDIENYPQDAPDLMTVEAKTAGYTFPYLFDDTQKVAMAYRAACTPDFFLFDRQRSLYYRGQFDDARPRNDQPVNGRDLRAACESLIAGDTAPAEQKPSLGCNIKWRKGNEPDYY